MSVHRGVAFVVCAAVSGSAVPQARVETLSGKRLELSRDIASGFALLIIGFTKASRAQTSEWSRRLEPELSKSSAVQVHEVAVVADVPKLMRGFVIRQIRSSVPKSIHSRFLLVLENADEWKRLAGAVDEDAAYLILISHGEVVWRGTGKLTEATYQSLIQALGASAVRHERETSGETGNASRP